MPKQVKTAQSHRASMSISATVAAAGGGSTRNNTSWSAKDDETLITARASGYNWNQIAPRYFPSKTPNACRKRHERLMEKRNAEEWDGVRLEDLATAYMEVRKQMWSILADKVGEKWTLVEQKCMEKGYKNLAQAHRSAQRKQGITTHENDDSGYTGSDLEDEIEDRHADALVSPVSYPSSHAQRVPSIQSMLAVQPPTYPSYS
ncbi:hypothetical protein GQ43DRAFT_361374 [Delitschia confertaspora ATCC 74209]|uniref:Myb-like domain-containing protein n=1 Tax=Delitschia confertaspora ATCC 74209 TaxID=1513339 RepID=A0A9P4MWL9_9PLEO|nr:hypothetical protein GQ43DRAFT_361374 [Delitschia confertaspora ATCC 74209]